MEMHCKSSHPDVKKIKQRMKYTEDRRDCHGLTHNMGMSTHQWKEVEAQFKAKPGCFLYIFPTVYFIMMTCFFLASIQTPFKASYKFHFKIFNRLSQTLQFPQNIGWTIKGIMFHIVLIGNVCIEYH